jgi:predicted RNase H-like HicB family nuclease
MTAITVKTRTFIYVIERYHETNFYVGHVPGMPGLHSFGDTLEELHSNIREVLFLLRESGHLMLLSNEEAVIGNIVVLEDK